MVDTVQHRYGWQTRIFHAALAIAIITQLATSQFMTRPRAGAEGDWIFEIHEYSGIAAFVLALALFLRIAIRPRGTAMVQLFPWFSGVRLKALGADIKAHWSAAKKFNIPNSDRGSALPSAVHGLGLLLMLVMAITGVTYWAADKFGAGKSPVVGAALEVHELFSNLVWAYLIGHATLALIHHFKGQASIFEMWSFRRDKA